MQPTKTETITLGGGCFWCLEALFQNLQGVLRVESGYAGGRVDHPTYEQVCSGTSGHAEVVQVTFDPQVISFRELLEVFFAFHNPTTLNRQGPDQGSQYRSVIFYHTPEQQECAREVMAGLEQAGVGPLVTGLEPLTNYYPAEPYQQQYYQNHPQQPYCQAIILPKLAKLRQQYTAKLKR